MSWVSSTLKAQPLHGIATLVTALFLTTLVFCSFDTSTFLGSWKTQLVRGFEAPAMVINPQSERLLVPSKPWTENRTRDSVNSGTILPLQGIRTSDQANETRTSPYLSKNSIVNKKPTSPLQTTRTQTSLSETGISAEPNSPLRGIRPRAEEKETDTSNGIPEKTSSFQWIRFPVEENETEALLHILENNGTKPCHALKTTRIEFLGLPHGNPVVLLAGRIHNFIMAAYDEHGHPRCAGGDYLEADISGSSWKSRPPVTDMGNGSYSIGLQVDPRFEGLYTLKIILLFGNYNGLHLRPERWVRREELVSMEIKFVAEGSNLRPGLEQCRASNYKLPAWSGRWTRGSYNETCEISYNGRFECLDPREPCAEPWCEGPVGSLESNGWVYSAHCSFRIFDAESAWECLDGRWLFFWGDSNHGDSIRNLLNFILGLWDVKAVSRRFDQTFTNGSKRVRITNMFNGHWNESRNYQGVYSLTDADFRDKLKSFFVGDELPDVMIMNSGLHDGVYWKNVRLFARGAEQAAEFWDSVMKSVKNRSKKPVFLYRTTIATGGYARALSFNPHKMEAFNHILLEKLRERNLVSMVVDDFDLTYAWHYDNNCSDGVHYGRAPARAKWHGQIGHQYFVDLMLVHILLNAICLG
eukprot:Gb_21364 [translate_table: standard]